jgi:hypothetical protein
MAESLRVGEGSNRRKVTVRLSSVKALPRRGKAQTGYAQEDSSFRADGAEFRALFPEACSPIVRAIRRNTDQCLISNEATVSDAVTCAGLLRTGCSAISVIAR